MFITAVCLIFLLKLKWPKNKSVYERSSFIEPHFDYCIVVWDGLSRQLHEKLQNYKIVDSSQPLFHARERKSKREARGGAGISTPTP